MDQAYDQTEEALAALEQDISRLYSQASKELEIKINVYFDSFRKRDEQQRTLMEAGEISKKQYQLWRLNQIGRGERFIALQNEIAQRCNQANVTAAAYISDSTPGIYSLNYNYNAYTIEKVHGNVGFTLIPEQTVRRLIAETPDILPEPRVDIPLDLRWNKQKIREQLVSGIMQGESIGKIADHFQSITDMNRVSALRNARTAVTGAQNAGRQASITKAVEMGIPLRRRWRVVKDGRTRHSHRRLDGEIVEVDGKFSNGLRYPGDPSGDASEIYNCRCGIETVEAEGIEAEPRQMRVQNPKYTKALEEEEKTRKKYERARQREMAETDPEKRKVLRAKRLTLQKQLKERERQRKSIRKNLVVNEMSYSEWLEWKEWSDL